MKNIIFILSLISIISCKKEQNQAAQNVSSSDSLAVKTDSIQTKNDTIKSVDDIKKEYAEVNALLTSKKLDSTGFKYICEEGGNGPVQCLEKKYVIRSAGNNQDQGTIPNKEIKCNVDELMKTYQSILKNKDKKGEINQCL
jgi:hypothetical protein